MACCAVFGCNNNKKKNKDLKFYGFPKDENIAKQWVVACRRKDTINIKSARVCSAHFEKSDFFESLRHRLLGYSPRNCRNLKEDAIPSVKVPFKKDVGTSSKRSIRVEKRARRKMANEILDKTSPEAVDGLEQQETSLTDTLASSVEVLQEFQDQQDRLGNISSSVEGVENDEDGFDGSTISSSAVNDQSQYKNLGKSRLQSSVTTVPECECKCLVTAANILAAKSMIKLQRENEELKTEITELNNQLQYLKNERKNFISERLKPIFTDGQIRCLFQPVRKRICWSDEDITSAITLRSVSPNAYRYLREKLNYPLPAVSTLRKWVRMKLEREPSQQILDLVRAKLPSLASLED